MFLLKRNKLGSDDNNVEQNTEIRFKIKHGRPVKLNFKWICFNDARLWVRVCPKGLKNGLISGRKWPVTGHGVWSFISPQIIYRLIIHYFSWLLNYFQRAAIHFAFVVNLLKRVRPRMIWLWKNSLFKWNALAFIRRLRLIGSVNAGKQVTDGWLAD